MKQAREAVAEKVTVLTAENIQNVPEEVRAVFEKMQRGELISPKRKKSLLEEAARKTQALFLTMPSLTLNQVIAEITPCLPDKLPSAFLVELTAEMVKQWQACKQSVELQGVH